MTETPETPENRRPLKTRSAGWAGALASALGKAVVLAINMSSNPVRALMICT